MLKSILKLVIRGSHSKTQVTFVIAINTKELFIAVISVQKFFFTQKPTIHDNEGTRSVKEYGETATCNLASVNLKRHFGVNKHGENLLITKS